MFIQLRPKPANKHWPRCWTPWPPMTASRGVSCLLLKWPLFNCKQINAYQGVFFSGQGSIAQIKNILKSYSNLMNLNQTYHHLMCTRIAKISQWCWVVVRRRVTLSRPKRRVLRELSDFNRVQKSTVLERRRWERNNRSDAIHSHTVNSLFLKFHDILADL